MTDAGQLAASSGEHEAHLRAAQLERMNRRLRSLLSLARQVVVASSVEDCIALFCETLSADLGAAPPQRWRGAIDDEQPEPLRRAADEARALGTVATRALEEGGFGLVMPLPSQRSSSELALFRRQEPFTEQDQTIAGLAASFLEAAIRSQLAMQELRESQAQLHQGERIKSIGQLAGGVAHDFNNMLMVISAAAEVMGDMIAPDDPCAKHLELIIDTSHRAAELTQKLLAFSRKGRLSMKPVDVHDVLGSVREFLAHALDRRITLQLSLAAGPCVVDADSTQLQNALLNLCLNARDAMPDGGLLRISTERVELDTEAASALVPDGKPGAYVRIEVYDTGSGMDEQTLSHAFEPFFTTKEPGRGTGLGLSVVFSSIREHRGSVRLESQLQQGTRCVILLPLADRARPEISPSAPLGRSRGSLRIFLLDDEPGVCRTAAQLLRQLGHNVLALLDGEKALQHLLTHSSGYDLLVLDVMMPHPTGIEVHHALRDEGVELPTVFVSGYTEQHLLEGLSAGPGLAFLQKPFRQAELSLAISRCLEGLPSKLPSPASAWQAEHGAPR